MKVFNIKLVALVFAFAILSQVNYACDIDNCKTCSSVSDKQCQTCEDGYGTDGLKGDGSVTCFKCSDGCSTCMKGEIDGEEQEICKSFTVSAYSWILVSGIVLSMALFK